MNFSEKKQESITMKRDKLLELLQNDTEIRATIQNIINNPQNNADEKTTEKENNDKEEIEMLKALVEKWKKLFGQEEIKTQKLKEDLTSKSEDLSHKSQELSNLTSQKNSLEKEIQTLTQQQNRLQNENKEIQANNKALQNSKNSLHDKVEFYKANFADELKAYERYGSLSAETRESLKGIFKDNSLSGFVTCGVQEKNIHSLWEYLKSEIIEQKNRDVDTLVEIFDYLFARYLMAYPQYKKQEVHVGENFNTDIHIRDSSSSSVSGAISKIMLYGWVNTKTEKIVKKSLVRI